MKSQMENERLYAAKLRAESDQQWAQKLESLKQEMQRMTWIVLIATFLDVFDAGLFVRYCHTANFDRELLPSCHLISFDGCI